MTSTEDIVAAGNDQYKENHLAAMFRDGFSFSGYERDGFYLSVAPNDASAATQSNGTDTQAGPRRRFANVSGVSGLDSPSDGRATVFADFDNDGDIDIFLTTIQGDAHLLYRNEVGADFGFLRIALRGTTSGTDAFSAVVRVGTSRGVQTQVKSGGEGYLAEHDPRLLFGLGRDESAEWVEVTWPNGTKQRFDQPFPSRSSWLLVEGDATPHSVRETRTSLPAPYAQDQALLASLGLEKGGELPNFDVVGRDGSTKPWKSTLAPNQRALVNLWATWCVPCKTEMPELQKKASYFESKEIQLLGLSIDTREDMSGIGRFLEERGVTYPVALGGSSAVDAIYGDGEVFVPLTFVLDERGKIETAFGGWNAESRRRVEQWAEGSGAR
ncbi:MAG: redoxin domain-containing protein [Candidatus Eisenbacteria bacterium]|nr:redoxin domain-containing protein [Candidatus Eisenbacteria bacterium]